MEDQKQQITKASDLFSWIKQFDLDPEGIFKYILISAQFKGETVYFVRGSKSFAFHSQNFEEFASELRNCGLNYSKFEYDEGGDTIQAALNDTKQQLTFFATGGGRANISQTQKKLQLYGYSQSFGQANHSIAIDIAKESLKDFPKENFSWSNEGY